MDTVPATSLHLRPIRLEDAAIVASLSGELGYERTPDEVRAWVERLIAMLEGLGQEVEVSVDVHPRRPAAAFVQPGA